MSGSANLPLQFNRDRTERQLDARLAELLDKLKKNRPADDPWLVRRAYDIAAERHRDQLRRSGDPYLTHLLEVAHILADMRMDATTLSAALLHDVTITPFGHLMEEALRYAGRAYDHERRLEEVFLGRSVGHRQAGARAVVIHSGAAQHGGLD